MNNKDGVVILISDLCSGGAQKVASTLANYWADQDRRVYVITMKAESEDFFSLSKNVHRIVIGEVQPSTSAVSALTANFSRIKKIRKAIIEANQSTIISFVTSTNILSILAAFGLSKRIIISERNDPARQSHGKMWDFLRRKLYRYASTVTANSQQAVESMKEYVPDHKLRYVPNPIQMPERVFDGERNKTVLHVGKLIEQKAHDIILQAWEIVHKSHPDWKIDFVGDGPLLYEMKQLSEALRANPSVHWHGWCQNVDEFYQSSGIFILPSRFEGTPNALMEAMSYGMPCIVSDGTGGALDLIEHEKSGLIVPAEDTRALALAIECLIQDKDLRGKLGSTAREKIRTNELSQVMKVWDEVAGFTHPSTLS